MIWAILIIGFLLRLLNLNQSLWLDEAINVIAVKSHSLYGMITQYAVADFHPPGWFIILWIWGKIFGYSEISVRLPSVLFGVLTILVMYLIGKKLVNNKFGFISALLLTVNPLHIYYSQEARMYSMAAFAVTLNMYLFINLLKSSKEGFFSKLIYILSNILILMSDYVAYFIFPAQLIILLFVKNQTMVKRWVLNIVLSGVFTYWWIPTFLNQLKVGSEATVNIPVWSTVVGAFGLKPLILTYIKFIVGRISFPNHAIYMIIFIPIGTIFLYLIWQGFKSTQKITRNYLVIWLFLPIIIASLVALVIPVYSYFRLLFVLPSFLILIAFGIYSFNKKFKLLFLFLIIIIEVIFSSTYLFNKNFHREDWRGLVSFLESKSSNSKILFESSGTFSPFEYYSNNDIRAIGALKKFPAENSNDLNDLENILSQSKDVYLINYLVEISDPSRLVAKKLSELKYIQSETTDFQGVGFVYHYIKI